MFCGKCGAQNEDGTQFCKKCGAPLSAAPVAGTPQPPVSNPVPPAGNPVPPIGGSPAKPAAAGLKLDHKTMGIIAVAAVAVVLVVVILIVALGGGRNPKGVVDDLMTGTFKGDAKKILSLFPDDVLTEIYDQTDMTRKEMLSELEDSLEDSLERYDRRYDKWSYSYKIVDEEDLTKKELKNLIEQYDDMDIDINIKAAKTLSVKLTIKADGDTDSDTMDITVIQVGRSWYLDVVSMGSILY